MSLPQWLNHFEAMHRDDGSVGSLGMCAKVRSTQLWREIAYCKKLVKTKQFDNQECAPYGGPELRSSKRTKSTHSR